MQELCKKFDHLFTDFLKISMTDSEISGDVITSVLIYHVCCAFMNAEMNMDELTKSFQKQWEIISITDLQENLDMESKKEKSKVKKVMSEFKHGDLHSGSKKGPQVKDRKQAVAIAI